MSVKLKAEFIFCTYVPLMDFLYLCPLCFDGLSLREKCPNTEFFWSVFSRIRTEYGPGKTLYLDTFHAVFKQVDFNSFMTEAVII